MQDFSFARNRTAEVWFSSCRFSSCECPDHGSFRFGVTPDLPPVGESIAEKEYQPKVRAVAGIDGRGAYRKKFNVPANAPP
jgi:hypothetical protein